MTIRELRKDEWSRVAEIFSSFGEVLPYAPTSIIVVAEDNGLIVGLVTAQLMLHVEPLWVKRSHQGRFLIPRLVKKLLEVIPDVQYALTTTSNPKVEVLLGRLGFKQLKSNLYRWLKEIR